MCGREEKKWEWEAIGEEMNFTYHLQQGKAMPLKVLKPNLLPQAA